MNEATLAVGQTRSSASPASVRVFLALLRKDLRLAAPIVTTFFAFLVAIAGFFAALPLFGNQAMRSFGFYAGVDSVWDRLGLLQPLFAGTLAVATILSALYIASREGGARSRFLLPTLPVSTRLAYLSKIQALLMIFALFLALLPLTDHGGMSRIGLSPVLVAFIAAMSGWAFAAPYFVRGIAGGFLTATLLPICLSLLIILGGQRLIPAIFIELFHRWELDYWYRYPPWRVFDTRGDQQLMSSTQRLIDNCTSGYAFATVTLLGLWAAWRARKAVLCRQTPQPLSAARVGRLLLIAFAAAATVVVAASVHAWSADPSIRSAVERSQWHARTAQLTTDADRLLSMPTDALVREYSLVLASDHDARESRLEVQNAAYRKMDRKAKQSSGWNLAQVLSTSPASQDHIARAVAVENALSRRRTDDPAGFETTIAGFLAGLERNQIPAWIQLQIAALIGPRTQLSLALKLIAADPSDIDRVHLVSMIGNDWLIGTIVLADGSARPSVAVPDPLNPLHEFALLGLPPFEPVPWRGFGRTDGAASRISAVVVLAALRQRLEAGTLATVDPVNPIDRLSIDAGILARAREAIERPFTELARDLAIPVPPTGNPALIEWMSDSERLYLRTSELFDPAKTDPSYLLPNR